MIITKRSCKSKITELQNTIMKQNVLGFDVSMYEFVLVHFLHTGEKLQKEGSRELLLKATCVHQISEQLSTIAELRSNRKRIFRSQSSILLELENLNDMTCLRFQHRHGFDLVLQMLHVLVAHTVLEHELDRTRLSRPAMRCAIHFSLKTLT
jgi:hypothetical protein